METKTNSFNAISKRLSKQYRRNGNAFVDYILEDAEGYIKSISPIQWTKLNLKDTTSEYQEKECYNLLIQHLRKTENFGRFIEMVKKAKAQNITMENNPKEFYLLAIGAK